MPNTQTQSKLNWDKNSLAKLEKMIERIPMFHREIANQVARKRAEINAQERGSAVVEEPDIVRAFFSEVPMAFYSLMIKLLRDVGFNYKEYVPKYEKKS